MTAVQGFDHPGTTAVTDRRVEIDLAEVRSQIADLHSESISLATDLLAVLGPLQRYVAQAIDQGSSTTQVVELTRTFDESEQAVLEVTGDDIDQVVLDLSNIGR